MKEKTKEEERKRILGLYKAAYEVDMREKEGGFCGIKKRRAQKKKKEEGYKYMSRDFARLYQEEEKRKGEKRGEEIKARHERNKEINSKRLKETSNKTKVYIHKGDTKLYKEIKPKIDKERGAGRFCIDFDIDIIEEIRKRHKKTYKELIAEGPAMIRPFNYNKSYFFEHGLKRKDITDQIREGEEIKTFVQYRHNLNKKIDYTGDLLPYNNITIESADRINKRFLKEEYNDSTWKIGIKQFSLKGAKTKRYIDITGEIKEIKVVAGKYQPIRSANEKKYLFGRKSEVNIYKDIEVKNRTDYQKREKMPLYWRYIENGHILLMDLQKELNAFCQKNNIETKRAWPFLKNLVESVNIRGYTKGNLDVLKNIWAQVQIIKERLLIENTTHQA